MGARRALAGGGWRVRMVVGMWFGYWTRLVNCVVVRSDVFAVVVCGVVCVSCWRLCFGCCLRQQIARACSAAVALGVGLPRAQVKGSCSQRCTELDAVLVRYFAHI